MAIFARLICVLVGLGLGLGGGAYFAATAAPERPDKSDRIIVGVIALAGGLVGAFTGLGLGNMIAGSPPKT